MDRVIIWGCGSLYNHIINQIILLEQQQKIIRIAVACKEELPLTHIDGVKRIWPEEIEEQEYDYVIIAMNQWREAIEEQKHNGLQEEKCIWGQSLMVPLFDWERYIKLKKNKSSVISDTC